MNSTPVNRLILIGNGFDLAHNMKTSYIDFIFWYIESSLDTAQKTGNYQDRLLSIEFIGHHSIRLPNVNSNKDYVHFFYRLGFSEMTKSVFKFKDNLMDHYNPYKIVFPSAFFLGLLKKCSSARWVDIENEYYSFLKEISFSDSGKSHKIINDLNVKFGYLIELLERYLAQLPTPKPISEYHKIFKEALHANEFQEDNLIAANKMPDKTLVLNFNYTFTPEQYIDNGLKKLRTRTSINYIHGKCDSTNNPLIFGFGDELDKDYEKLESHISKDLFNYFKSFWYFKTSNYYNLIRFIDNSSYQVCILGHSCGLSDRTMLNMIFEHENCKSIKIFYYEKDGKNNYTETTQEISRHFRNKQRMRKLIVSFDKCKKMPQLST